MNSLLMTAENGQKVYDRVKTQTRRLLSWPLYGKHDGGKRRIFMADDIDDVRRLIVSPGRHPSQCVVLPYRVGELRYIREPHYLYGRWQRDGHTKTGKAKYRFVADRSKGACYPNNPPPRVCTRKRAVGWFRRPGMFMFEWAARSIVEIVEVRIERVQEISEADAIAEGVEAIAKTTDQSRQFYKSYRLSGDSTFCEQTARDSFMTLWESIHGPGAWERNDWVWAVTMRRVGR